MYNLKQPIICFPPKGQTQYYSETISSEDADELDKIYGKMVENTTIREDPDKYVIEVASVERHTDRLEKTYKGK